jgi:hypothetical protein
MRIESSVTPWGLFCFGEGPAKLVGDRHAPRFRWGDLGPIEVDDRSRLGGGDGGGCGQVLP